MAINATVKEILEGIATTKVEETVMTLNDAIDVLNNANRVTLKPGEKHYVRYYDADGNVLSETDKYGVAPSASNSAVEDRTYYEEKIEMPNVEEISVTIGINSFGQYGIDSVTDFLKSPNSYSEAQINGMGFSINKEVEILLQKVREAERKEVSVFLDELGASSDPFVLPFGEQLVASSGRTKWNWSNKGTAAMSSDELDAALNAMSLQKNINGHLVGGNPIQLLFHARNITGANKLLMPDQVVNSAYKSIADINQMNGLPNSFKMAGSYETTDLNDWIIIAQKNFIKRVSRSSYENYKVSIFPLLDKNQVKICVNKSSILVCDSPIGIWKAIVANS